MLRILIVDDDPDHRHLLKEALGGHHTVVEAGSASVACDMQPESFDLIITDLRMPGMSGVDLKHRLDREGIAVPVILVSSDSEVGNEAMKAGFVDFLHKPYSPDQLDAIIALVSSRIVAPPVAVPTVAPAGLEGDAPAPPVDTEEDPGSS